MNIYINGIICWKKNVPFMPCILELYQKAQLYLDLQLQNSVTIEDTLYNCVILSQAAAVAARLAQSIGHSVNEEVKMPEKIAGLINGRCGNEDELKSIQSLTNCKITFPRESGKNILYYFIKLRKSFLIIYNISRQIGYAH